LDALREETPPNLQYLMTGSISALLRHPQTANNMAIRSIANAFMSLNAIPDSRLQLRKCRKKRESILSHY
jgi:hypothetical protein